MKQKNLLGWSLLLYSIDQDEIMQIDMNKINGDIKKDSLEKFLAQEVG